ncbi:MAG: heparinase II/III-family protein [Nitrospina sp.]|nr:heparinase II/III-family protein [Nitrospina sp.]
MRLQKGDAVLIADVGKIGPDYLPGHAHADTLSFEFSYYGKRVFVNSGISCYGNSKERFLQRGTACHNTLVVNGENSSAVWGGFRVAKRAYPLGLEVEDKKNQGLRIRCGHDGYARLKGKPAHWREWCVKDNSLEIKDQVTGEFSEAEAFYHLYPGATVDLQEKEILLDDICIKFQTDAETFLKDTCYYSEFGKVVQNKCLVLKPVNNRYFIKFVCHKGCN